MQHFFKFNVLLFTGDSYIRNYIFFFLAPKNIHFLYNNYL